MSQHGLKLAEEKTEAVILKGPRKRENVIFECGSTEITPKKCVKYLGVTLHTNGSWGEHLRVVTCTATERAAALGGIMPNIGGPKPERRRALHGVVQSIVLYAAPVWSGERTRTDRTSLLRVASAYRTVSATALWVITGCMSSHILACERTRLFNRARKTGVTESAKREERATSIQMWQAEWEATVDVAQ
ncbi:uncharacterized protein [Diabrotica undecimpunctata]|uniref:uncharacterized protein n=1 Tax=Diabrotica undecimpunctata TaxID=50387 RepID=UPI003B63F7F8